MSFGGANWERVRRWPISRFRVFLPDHLPQGRGAAAHCVVTALPDLATGRYGYAAPVVRGSKSSRTCRDRGGQLDGGPAQGQSTGDEVRRRYPRDPSAGPAGSTARHRLPVADVPDR